MDLIHDTEKKRPFAACFVAADIRTDTEQTLRNLLWYVVPMHLMYLRVNRLLITICFDVSLVRIFPKFSLLWGKLPDR